MNVLVFADPDMQSEIDTHISEGQATFNVLMLNHAREITLWVPVLKKVETKTLLNFFPFFLILVDRVTWYLLLVGGSKYLVELVEEDFPDLFRIAQDPNSVIAANREGMNWDLRFRRNMHDWEVNDLKGVYTVKEGYQQLCSRNPVIDNKPWKLIWRTKPPKVASKLWSMFFCLSGINWTTSLTVKDAYEKRNKRCFDGESTALGILKTRCIANLFSWSNLYPAVNAEQLQDFTNSLVLA
ncbi:hypothetical protein H5410_051111 [Solanum commersonii]|uniref:Reverse transcriptase zinc-binding domain-containing protein n=1 Tax=Solanum commersonii TaxID=4109 RepID=A0A9J5WZJ3_SOLCO|nr:hypothetical protein H5410_051111 [Solanum commersonii]